MIVYNDATVDPGGGSGCGRCERNCDEGCTRIEIPDTPPLGVCADISKVARALNMPLYNDARFQVLLFVQIG